MVILIVGCVLVVFVLLFLFLLKVYAVLTLGKCRSQRKLQGKTALVTGSSRAQTAEARKLKFGQLTGIGYRTALNLAKRGAKVIITSKNHEDLLRAQKQMIQESGNYNIVAKHLDLLSLAGIRAFVEDILATESKIDILVNNAGTTGLGNTLTEDGLLAGLQVNYLGPFLLTNLLIGLLKKAGNSRIVNVASWIGNVPLGFNVNNITSIPFPFIFEFCVYRNSKLCVAHATIEMAKRLEGSGVTVNCLHPGFVYTNIYNDTRIIIVKFVVSILGPLYFKTPKEGAETSIHLACCETVEGVTGKYFSDCKKSWMCANLGQEVRAKVWEQSVKLAGLKPEEMEL